MNKKTNVFVCLFIALFINLQSCVSAFADDEEINTDAEQEITETDSSIINGIEISGTANDLDLIEEQNNLDENQAPETN